MFLSHTRVNSDMCSSHSPLSVGDMTFQAKCAERMSQFARQGVTIVFVSHNLQAVRTLCAKTLFLQGGQVRAYGGTESVLETYVSYLRHKIDAVDPPLINTVRGVGYTLRLPPERS